MGLPAARVAPFLAKQVDRPQGDGVFARLPILALGLLAGSAALGQQKPPTPKLTGYRVTAEGGVEGTRTIRYDENGKPVDGQAAPAPTRPAPNLTGQGASAIPAPTLAAPPAPAPTSAGEPRGLRTADGRPLPFSVTRSAGGKTVDESVDADSALREFGRPNDLLSQRFPTNQVELTLDDRFSTSRTVTLGTWGASFSSLGGKRADIALRDTLGAEVRAKDTVDVRSVERRDSPWSRRTAEPVGWDERVGGPAELAERRVDDASLAGTFASLKAAARLPRGLDQLSMQDINRYQFRRARSTEPGLPVVRPGGGGEVRPSRGD